MTHYHDVTLRIESGEHAGEEVNLKYDPGVRNGEKVMEPVFKEDCYYVVNHEEWERIAAEAVASVLESLPKDMWFEETIMSRVPHSETQTNKLITDGSTEGMVCVFIDMQACDLTEDDMKSLLTKLQNNLEQTGLCGLCSVNGCTSEYISAKERPDASVLTWSETLPFGS